MICYNITSLTDDPAGVKLMAAGVKLMESSTRTLKAVLFPRSALKIFKTMDEARQAGAYILYHTADKHEQPQIYIGQSGTSCYDRLASHNRSKDFWNYAMVFVESQEYMNAAHVKTIESILIRRATECGIVVMDNDTGSKAPPMKTFDRMSAETWANEIVEICRLLGLSFFEKDRQDMVLTMEEKAESVPEAPLAESARPDMDIELPPGTAAVLVDGRPVWTKQGAPAVEGTVKLCEACIEAYGYEMFRDTVLKYPFFPHARTRVLFSMDEADMRGFSCHRFDSGLYMLTNYSANTLTRIRTMVSELFPRCTCVMDSAGSAHLEFWQGFFEYIKADGRVPAEFKLQKPHTGHYADFHFGAPGCHIAATHFTTAGSDIGSIGVEVYIGDDKDMFYRMRDHRTEIEVIVGEVFEWQELSKKKACRIRTQKDVSFGTDSDRFGQYAWIMETMLKLKAAVAPYLKG